VINGSDDVKNEISSLFETYCHEYVAAMLPSHRVRGSFTYGNRKAPQDSPDLLIEDG
jgi:hypothetical protein